MADKKPEPKQQSATLQEQILAKQLDLIEAKKSLAAKELQNPRAIKNLKKDIARLLTKLNNDKGKE
jgi:ribosomal protein L29